MPQQQYASRSSKYQQSRSAIAVTCTCPKHGVSFTCKNRTHVQQARALRLFNVNPAQWAFDDFDACHSFKRRNP